MAYDLDADEEELLLLADKVPAGIRKRIREYPEVFRAVAQLDEKGMNHLMKQLDRK